MNIELEKEAFDGDERIDERVKRNVSRKNLGCSSIYNALDVTQDF